MAVDIQGTIGQIIPSFGANVILYSIITIIVIAGIGIGFWLLIRNNKFNKTIVIFEKIGGQWIITSRDKAMEINLGKSGEKVLYVKKAKRYLPRGNKQTGKNIYWYAIDGAGHWHNIGIEVIDLGKEEVEMNMQIGMDYARAGIQKLTLDRYNKLSWLKEHWTVLVSIGVILILLVFIWLDIREQVNLVSSAKGAVDAAAKVNDASAKILEGLNNIVNGGSGIKPATPP